MKSARLLRMLLLLQAKSPRSARDLAADLEVCERTVYRDVDALSAGGVPIFTTRGSQGGIHLVDGYRRAIAQLEEDEIHALYVSGSDPLADLGFTSPLQRVREKLSGALSERQKDLAQKTSARIRIDQRRWGQSDVPTETLAVLRRAVWDDRLLELSYRDRSGARTVRRVEPLGLIAKSGVWYVVARDGTDYRSFRADRIVRVDMLAEHFQRPADFDLDAYWTQATSRYEDATPAYSVTLRVPSTAIDDVTGYWHPVSAQQHGDDTIIRFEFPAKGAALHQLVAWGARVTVLEPQEIVADMVAIARDVLERYATGDA